MMQGNDESGLYRRAFEHDSCGFGMICQMDGEASHALVEGAIKALSRLSHRGAVAADGKSGDGCGLLMKLPTEFFRAIAAEHHISLAPLFAVGMVFISRAAESADMERQRLQAELEKQGLGVAGWRVVPVNIEALGESAVESLPRVEQIFVNIPFDDDIELAERKLFLAKRKARKFIKTWDAAFHIVSLSTRVTCYKGLVMPHKLPLLYPDLDDPRLHSALCIFHQRFSTNTWPEWRLAQPFRYLAHNGEINTIQGNRNWAQARSRAFESPLIPGMKDIRPWLSLAGSDSYSLDNMLETLVAGGMDLLKAMRLLIPRAWQNDTNMDPELRAFYEYHAMHAEAWDGPAGIVLTDGRYAACTMDRNGLRPARYVITRDRLLILASEIGVSDIDPQLVLHKGRLSPGDLLAVDTSNGELLTPQIIEDRLKRQHPYRKWLQRRAIYLAAGDSLADDIMTLPAARHKHYQKMFQLSREELDQVIRVIVESGQETSASMGDDTPLPVFSNRLRSLYDYFRQQFAQVTNPPIDSLREQRVMSLQTCFGPQQNIFIADEAHAARVVTPSPVLSSDEYSQLLAQEQYPHQWIDLNYTDSMNLETAIRNICYQAEKAVWSGASILVLSDRSLAPGKLPLHAALATGAVHHHLVNIGLRCSANLVVETGTARNPHEFAVLIGVGATAVFPYLAYQCALQFAGSPATPEQARSALASYRHGIDKGLYKILSKMGISTISSYRGAQLFEVLGLASEVADLCFKGINCRLEGSGFSELEAAQRKLAAQAFDPLLAMEHGGYVKYVHNGEYHAFNPGVVQALGRFTRSQNPADYNDYAELVNRRPAMAPRDLMALRPAARPLRSIRSNPPPPFLSGLKAAPCHSARCRPRPTSHSPSP